MLQPKKIIKEVRWCELFDTTAVFGNDLYLRTNSCTHTHTHTHTRTHTHAPTHARTSTMQVVDGMTEEEFAKRKTEQEEERKALEEVCACVLASNDNARALFPRITSCVVLYAIVSKQGRSWRRKSAN